MKITFHQTRNGRWLVHEARPHTLGVGVEKVGTPTGAHVTGCQFGAYLTEVEAEGHACRLCANNGWELVEWQPPTETNEQFIDLDQPDDETIHLNADKTIEWYRGFVLKNVDVTPRPHFGYEFAICLMATGKVFLNSKDGGYRLGDLKWAILEARDHVDKLLEGE